MVREGDVDSKRTTTWPIPLHFALDMRGRFQSIVCFQSFKMDIFYWKFTYFVESERIQGILMRDAYKTVVGILTRPIDLMANALRQKCFDIKIVSTDW